MPLFLKIIMQNNILLLVSHLSITQDVIFLTNAVVFCSEDNFIKKI